MRVIILSCVRSRARFWEEDDKKRGLGLIGERKRYIRPLPKPSIRPPLTNANVPRMNVAITRARELLVIIGNGVMLMKDPYWKSYLQFTMRNKL
jgi:superfamily I DNA and/or RNA helicase